MSVVTSAIIDSAHPTYVIISRARACGPVISWPVMSFNTNKSDRFKNSFNSIKDKFAAIWPNCVFVYHFTNNIFKNQETYFQNYGKILKYILQNIIITHQNLINDQAIISSIPGAGGHSHWKVVQGCAALKTPPLFRPYLNSGYPPYSSPFPAPKTLLLFLYAFSSPVFPELG